MENIALATYEATAWVSQHKAAEGSPKARRRYKLFFSYHPGARLAACTIPLMAPFWGEEALAALVTLGRVREVDGLQTGRKLVYPGRGSNPGWWNADAMVISHRPRARAGSIFAKKTRDKIARQLLSVLCDRETKCAKGVPPSAFPPYTI